MHSQARITSEVSNVDSPRRSMVEIPPSYAMQPVFCHCKGSTEIPGVPLLYSHLFNKRGGWNKRVGGAKVAKSLNVEAGINVEGGIFWKKLVHKSNKRGVEGGKI